MGSCEVIFLPNLQQLHKNLTHKNNLTKESGAPADAALRSSCLWIGSIISGILSASFL